MPLPVRAQVVRLNDVADLAAAVPHLLGFHPSDSIVAVALRGPRARLSFTMRVDLPPAAADTRIAREVSKRMRRADATAVLLVVYTRRGRGELPRQRLVEEVQGALGVPLRDALLVDSGRVWSYLCAEPRCCPPEGRPLRVDSPGATAVAAAHALQGDAVLANRDALVATTRAVAGAAARSMRRAQERALARLLDDAPETLEPEESERFVTRLRARWDDPPATLTHDEAAETAIRLHDVRVRDRLLQQVVRGDEQLGLLLREVARLAQPPDDAPVAAMIGLLAYLRGDGVVATAAAERALDTDPGYSLARLVADCVAGQLDPRRAREVWAGADGA